MNTLTVLDNTGDSKLTWDPDNPLECANIRQAVAELSAVGYTFFLTDGRPADAVSAGGGVLLVKKLTAEEVVGPDPLVAKVDAASKAAGHVPGEAPEAVPEGTPEPVKKRKGRPPKNAPTPAQNVVAVRPMRGG